MKLLLSCLKGTFGILRSKPVNGALKAYTNCKFAQYGLTPLEVSLMKNGLKDCVKYGIQYGKSIFR